MTWFASHIYAEPTPAVISMLSAHPVLAKGLYLLNGKLYHKWPTEWQGRSKVRHGWPRNGILVAREICNPDTSKSPQSMKGHEAPWHHDAAISWTEISGSNGGDVILPPELPVRIRDEVVTNYPTGSYPPSAFLTFLKELSHTTNTMVTYYHHETGGNGVYEQEFAWVFDREDIVLVRYGNKYMIQYSKSGMSRIEFPSRSVEGVLNLVLKLYGLDLPSDYFAPHTRDFAWEKYRLE